ncbi:MAG: tRNA-dihydrouridine synthase [Burkholderiales bacterium]|nr:tRNA-dihydrouridine synthase [Burkholderiales bacterium]
MAILLAPMEGLLDFALRDVLTRVGGISLCVSEFIRVTDSVLPERVFFRVVPELAHGSRTPAGVPVRPQLLGSDAACLADNAARLATLGPAGIDLNFGCPARIVNRHGGGAALLKDPEQLHHIVAAVRRALPTGLVLSAKMRLGFDDDSRAEDCARAIAAGGADELVVHARTKAQAYRPPAYWERIADVCAAVTIPVVANGEIWTVDDARRCVQASGCTNLMLGRGMVADPGLALAVLADQGATLAAGAADDPQGAPGVAGVAGDPATMPASVSATTTGIPRMGITRPGWPELRPLLLYFWQLNLAHIDARARAGRMKQWLNFLRRVYPEAEQAFTALRTVSDARVMQAWLHEHLGTPPDTAPGQDVQPGRHMPMADAAPSRTDVIGA